MEVLAISRTSSTPHICFDAAKKLLVIAGESYPENSFAFYTPVLNWLKQYLKEQHELALDITITYMNSSSTKCMLDMLDAMEEGHSKGSNMSIVWWYDPENPRSYELAEEFSEEVTFPFEIKAIVL